MKYLDINECQLGTDNCSPFATCTDTPGSYQCTCNPGYTGDGRTCIGNLNEIIAFVPDTIID